MLTSQCRRARPLLFFYCTEPNVARWNLIRQRNVNTNNMQKTRIVHLKNIFLVTWLPNHVIARKQGLCSQYDTVHTNLPNLSVVCCCLHTELGDWNGNPISRTLIKTLALALSCFYSLSAYFQKRSTECAAKALKRTLATAAPERRKIHPWLGFTVSVFEDTRLWQSAFSDVTKETAPFPRPVTTPLVLVPFQHWAFLTWGP